MIRRDAPDRGWPTVVYPDFEALAVFGHLLARLAGRAVAEHAATTMEYNWRRNPDGAGAALPCRGSPRWIPGTRCARRTGPDPLQQAKPWYLTES